jgi:hypothetical protein
MKVNKLFLLVLLIAVVIVGFTTSRSFAQTNARYIPLGGAATGALYTPDSGLYSHVGIIAGHPTGNSLGCGPQWASRGFMVLCMNTRYFNNESYNQKVWK